jgi:D-beta-D-heptose 7-phosphate kinase/D-beta-D-heptose 1-phosphate adenosyltransferase
VACLQQAAREGDCLIVALNSDSSVRSLNKGPERPIFDQRHRAAVVAALEAVDYVVVFDETTPHALLERLKPDLLVKGGTYHEDEIVGRELVESYGGRVKAVGQIPGVSTTHIVDQIRDADEKIPAPHFPMSVPLPDAARNGMTAAETLQILKKLKWPSAPRKVG